MKKVMSKLYSIILTLAIVLGMMPIGAYASYTETATSYELNTDEITEDAEYMIIANGKALKNDNGKIGEVDVVVEDNKASIEDTTGVLWTFKQSQKGYTAKNGSKYLNLNANI